MFKVQCFFLVFKVSNFNLEQRSLIVSGHFLISPLPVTLIAREEIILISLHSQLLASIV
jgi:hypothetical protein